MSQFYTGYKDPIGTGEHYEGLKLSMNCFKKKVRAKIDMLLGIVTNEIEFEITQGLKPFAQAEINRLSCGGETINDTMVRMLKEGKNWDEIAKTIHSESDAIYRRGLY